MVIFLFDFKNQIVKRLVLCLRGRDDQMTCTNKLKFVTCGKEPSSSQTFPSRVVQGEQLKL